MLLCHYDYLNRRSNFSFHDESFEEINELPDVPERLRNEKVQIIGSWDGLICLCKSYTTFLIWNPSLGKVVELPPPPPPFPQRHLLRDLLGFGFDSENRDYKVVWIEFNESSDDVIHIFDLRKGAWRSSSSQKPRPRCLSHHSVYLHGNLHFPGKDETSSSYYILMSLDLSSEVLHGTEMKLDGAYPRLLLINGLLSVAMVKKRQGDALQDCYSVWSMKEYGVTESWTKLFTIEMPNSRNPITPLRFWENGEVLFVQLRWDANYKDGGNVLVLYNPESNKSIVLLSTNGVTLDACFFKESLVLL